MSTNKEKIDDKGTNNTQEKVENTNTVSNGENSKNTDTTTTTTNNTASTTATTDTTTTTTNEEGKNVEKVKKPKREEINDVPKSDRIPADVRVAVIGNVDSGKSTMIGVLTSGDLDDGRGSARSRILRHIHEQGSGRTSCSSQHIVGFDEKRNPVHQPVAISAGAKQKTEAWKLVVKTSNNTITFIDLAGHEKYLRTTISGLTGCFPDYAFIVVGANMGISKMTKEHIQVAVALCIPLFVVCTKIDIAPETVLKHTLKQLAKLLRSPSCNKMPIIMKRRKDIDTCFERDKYLERICPVFLISAVKGEGVDRLNNFLSKLKPRDAWKHPLSDVCEQKNREIEKMLQSDHSDKKTDEISDKKKQDLMAQISGELEIDETFAVKGVGIVLSGTVTAGKILPDQILYLGPFSDSTYKEIAVRSVHIKRIPVEYALAGETCSIAFRFIKRKEVVERSQIRKGMVAVSEFLRPLPVWAFRANILVLHHPTQINPGYQPVVHCGNIRQTATILRMSQERLRSGDSALVDLKFLAQPEFVHLNRAIIIREGNTKCIGKVVQLYETFDPAKQNFTEYITALYPNQAKEHTLSQSKKDENVSTTTNTTNTTAATTTGATAEDEKKSERKTESQNKEKKEGPSSSNNAKKQKVKSEKSTEKPKSEKPKSEKSKPEKSKPEKSAKTNKASGDQSNENATASTTNDTRNTNLNNKQSGGKSRLKKLPKDSKSKTDKGNKG